MPVYPAWQLFVEQHPYATKVAPTSLGLCGDSPPSMKPLNDNYLPAEGSFEVFMSNERSSTAWYAVDPVAWERVLEFTARHRDKLPLPDSGLAERSDVLALAERWLEASCPKWLMGWRDITGAEKVRTLIASVIPLAGVGDKFLLLWPKTEPRLAAVFLGSLNSLVCDYIARQKVGGTSFKYFTMKQIAVLPPERYGDAELDFLVPRVLELIYTANDLAPWAAALGYEGPPFPFDPARRAQLRAELDAYYARLYGLNREELHYILDPADVMGPDYPTETFRVLKQREMNTKGVGEYLTRRLVLEAFDRLQAGTLH